MSSIPVTLRMARASARAQPQGKPKRPGRADQRVREAGIVGWRLERGVILSVERSVDRDTGCGSHHRGSSLIRAAAAQRRRWTERTKAVDGNALEDHWAPAFDRTDPSTRQVSSDVDSPERTVKLGHAECGVGSLHHAHD